MLRPVLFNPQKLMAAMAHRNYNFMTMSPRKQRATPKPPLVVSLTSQEEEICTLLSDFCSETNSKRSDQDPVVCRIAGGWVRDKVLATLGSDSFGVEVLTPFSCSVSIATILTSLSIL
jgi:hypothetical protein